MKKVKIIGAYTMQLLCKTPTKKILQRKGNAVYLEITDMEENTTTYKCKTLTPVFAKELEHRCVVALNY